MTKRSAKDGEAVHETHCVAAWHDPGSAPRRNVDQQACEACGSPQRIGPTVSASPYG